MTWGRELASLVFQSRLALLPALNFFSHVAAKIFFSAHIILILGFETDKARYNVHSTLYYTNDMGDMMSTNVFADSNPLCC